MLSEIKSGREIQIPDRIIHMWNLNYDTNKPVYETESGDSETRLVVEGLGGEGGEEWELGISRCNWHTQNGDTTRT